MAEKAVQDVILVTGGSGLVGKAVEAVVKEAQPSDHILVMSNGGFAGIHDKLLNALSARFNKE